MINLELIRRFAKEFPGMEESTSYGTPAMKVRKRLVLRMHQREDAIVMLLESVEEQERLLTQDPENYYITDHYRDHAAILVRPTIEESQFRRLMASAWRRVARKKDVTEYDESQNPLAQNQGPGESLRDR